MPSTTLGQPVNRSSSRRITWSVVIALIVALALGWVLVNPKAQAPAPNMGSVDPVPPTNSNGATTNLPDGETPATAPGNTAPTHSTTAEPSRIVDPGNR